MCNTFVTLLFKPTLGGVSYLARLSTKYVSCHRQAKDKVPGFVAEGCIRVHRDIAKIKMH